MVAAKSHQTLVVKVMRGHARSWDLETRPPCSRFRSNLLEISVQITAIFDQFGFLDFVPEDLAVEQDDQGQSRYFLCPRIRQKSFRSTEKTHKKRFQNDSSSLVDSTPDPNGCFSLNSMLSNLGLFDGKETLKGLGSGLARGPFSNVTFAPTSPVSAVQPRKMLSPREDDNDQSPKSRISMKKSLHCSPFTYTHTYSRLRIKQPCGARGIKQWTVEHILDFAICNAALSSRVGDIHSYERGEARM
ncbi:hypothetical protein C8J55DRAFT_488151 [Lentinula edodes]|uniref:Uncharacterized protein n=1 Tax=Lentinula lateritia TaxID=40482 RepID=A0A9W9AL48_9AGAR|nr:hypothetical protein C8J55DRAFT_488151 [Lentinula edodes]